MLQYVAKLTSGKCTQYCNVSAVTLATNACTSETISMANVEVRKQGDVHDTIAHIKGYSHKILGMLLYSTCFESFISILNIIASTVCNMFQHFIYVHRS